MDTQVATFPTASHRCCVSACLRISADGILSTGGPGSTFPPVPIASAAVLALIELLVPDFDLRSVSNDYAQLGTVASAAVDPPDAHGPATTTLWLSPGRIVVREPLTGATTDATSVSRRLNKSLLRTVASARGA